MLSQASRKNTGRGGESLGPKRGSSTLFAWEGKAGPGCMCCSITRKTCQLKEWSPLSGRLGWRQGKDRRDTWRGLGMFKQLVLIFRLN